MDELEFRKRVYSDPLKPDQELLDAASANPDLQRILDEARDIDTRLQAAAASSSAPDSLRAKLMAIPANEDASAAVVGNPDLPRESANQPWYQKFVLAASLVLAVAASASFFIERGPSEAELAFGATVIEHLYHEASQIDAINAGILSANFPIATVNEVMANSGTQLRNANFLAQMPVRYANPCHITSPFKSSHLILQTSSGALNIIAIDNAPVGQEFAIGDERFSGMVVPFGSGNLIIIGEKNQELPELEGYRDLFSENLEWVI